MPHLMLFNHYAVGPDSPGGTRHYELARELINRGWAVTILASSFNHRTLVTEHLSPGSTYEIQVYEGVRFVWIRTPPYTRNDWRRLLSMLVYYYRSARVAAHLEPPDVVMGSSVHPFAALAAFEVAKRSRCSFVFEVRDLWPQTLVDLGRIPEYHPLIMGLRRLELFLYNRASRIIVLLPKASDYLRPRGIPEDRVFYLPNGVDLQPYSAPDECLPDTMEETLRSVQGKVVVAYIGAHGLANGLDTLVDAAAILDASHGQRIHFVLVGDGPEKERLVREVERKRLSNMDFLPPIPKKCVPAFLRRVHIGVDFVPTSPLYKYGISPNKDFDYMAAGLPIVMTGEAQGNPVDLSGGGVVLPHGGAPELAGALAELSCDEARRVNLGKKGRAFVEQNHAMSVLGQRLDGLLRLVMEQGSQGKDPAR